VRLQIYVPKRAADRWDPDPGNLSWQAFLRRLTDITGSATVLTGAGYWKGREGFAHEAVYIVETVIHGEPFPAYIQTWALLRQYAHQLLADGEESILIVQDNEPTLIRH
jgi:hypothetical protein